MTTDIKALYQAVERVEQHTTTKNRLLDLLRFGYENAPPNSPLRAKLDRTIDQEIRELGALHAERDLLRQQIAELRNDYERRGLKQCTACELYKPKHAFSAERRSSSGLQAQCRSCRAAWLRAYRRRAK